MLATGRLMPNALAVCFWHSFAWPGSDVFGSGTFDRPWNELGLVHLALDHRRERRFRDVGGGDRRLPVRVRAFLVHRRRVGGRGRRQRPWWLARGHAQQKHHLGVQPHAMHRAVGDTSASCTPSCVRSRIIPPLLPR